MSGLIGRLSVISVPPSFAIFAFLRWSRRSWFFFMRAISSSNLRMNAKNVRGNQKKKKGGGEDPPFLRPGITVGIARRRQRVSACRLVLDDLSSSYIRADDSRVSYDFRGPFAVDVTFDAQHPPSAVRSDAHIPVAFDR